MDEGAKFAIQFSVDGNGIAALGDMVGALGKVNAQLDEMAKHLKENEEETKKGFSNLSDLLTGLNKKVGDLSPIGAMMGLEEAQHHLDGLVEIAGRLRDVLTDGFKDVVKEAATFEDIESGLKFAFGDQWGKVFEDVKSDAANLTFTLEEVSGLAVSLGKMKINPFGGVDEASQKFESRTGAQVRALEVLQDTADAVNKSTGDLTVSLRNALAGQWKSLQDRFDIPKQKIQEWKKSIDALHDPQEKYNKLISELALMYGGAGKLKDMNWNKVSAQVPDLLQQLKAGAGKDGLKDMTVALKDFVTALTDMAKDERFIKSLSDAFKLFSNIVVVAIEAGTKLVGIIQTIVDFAPWVTQFFAALAIGTVVLGSVVVGIMSLTAATLALGVAVAAVGLPIFILTMGVAVLTLGAAMVALTAGVMVFVALWDIFKHNTENTLSTIERYKVLFGAIGEALKNWGEGVTYISDETKQTLDNLGLSETFLTLIGWIQKAKDFMKGFSDEFSARWTEMEAPITNVLLRIWDMVQILGAAFGLTFDDATSGIDGAEESGRNFGDTMADVLQWVADGVANALEWVFSLMSGFAETMNVLAEIYFYGVALWNILQIVGNFVTGTVVVGFNLLYAVVDNIVRGIVGVYQGLMGIMSLFDGDLATSEEAFGSMKDMFGGMGKAWNDVGKAVKQTGDDIGNNATDIDKAWSKHEDIANFGASVQAKMAAAQANMLADRNQQVDAGGIPTRVGDLTQIDIGEIKKRSAWQAGANNNFSPMSPTAPVPVPVFLADPGVSSSATPVSSTNSSLQSAPPTQINLTLDRQVLASVMTNINQNNQDRSGFSPAGGF